MHRILLSVLAVFVFVPGAALANCPGGNSGRIACTAAVNTGYYYANPRLFTGNTLCHIGATPDKDLVAYHNGTLRKQCVTDRGGALASNGTIDLDAKTCSFNCFITPIIGVN